MDVGINVSEARREYTRNWNFKKKYGITLHDYDKMLIECNYKCNICEKKHREAHNGLHVDHDHETGSVRGLLCKECNTAIGLLRDNTFLLDKAKKYLTIYGEKN